MQGSFEFPNRLVLCGGETFFVCVLKGGITEDKVNTAMERSFHDSDTLGMAAPQKKNTTRPPAKVTRRRTMANNSQRGARQGGPMRGVARAQAPHR